MGAPRGDQILFLAIGGYRNASRIDLDAILAKTVVTGA
jgi:hypothetical protein